MLMVNPAHMVAHKRELEVEQALIWAYRTELPKRQLSPSEALWCDLAVSGPYGPIDAGNSIQRYAYAGTPHPDADRIEAAVAALPMVEIDWDESFDAIMGDLAPMLTINDVRRDQQARGRATESSWPARTYRKSGGRDRAVNTPRDVLMVGTLQAAELVATHAQMGTRPRWYPQLESCHPTPSRNNPSQAAIVGECWGRNRYSTGSHCPLTWRPSPITVAQARADYLAWWRGLVILSESLILAEHRILPPSAPQMPWYDGEPPVWLYGQRQPPKLPKLPIKPQRDIAGRTRGQSEDVKRRYPVQRITP